MARLSHAGNRFTALAASAIGQCEAENGRIASQNVSSSRRRSCHIDETKPRAE